MTPDPLITRVLHYRAMGSPKCQRCGHIWPCASYHSASGWGSGRECREKKWCRHEQVEVR